MLKRIIIKINATSAAFGIDIIKFIQSIMGMPHFVKNYFQLKRQLNKSIYPFKISSFYPVLNDAFKTNGATSGHYFHQDLFVAQQINKRTPRIHFDVGSRIDGFVAHVASFRDVEVVDVRPTTLEIPNMKFHKADLSNPIPSALKGVCDSISCLHALEHFGLGRYGDVIDVNGYQKGFKNLIDMLEDGGILYLSIPIGKQRIEFNAHRVFSILTISNMVDDANCKIENFSYVDDSGNFHKNIVLNVATIDSSFNCSYGCGIFEIRK